MASPHRRTGIRSSDPPPGPPVPVTIHEGDDGEFVFVEAGNRSGWIASDLTVPRER